jgi:mgtE-like transporter
MTVYRFKRIVLESYPVLLACVAIGMGAGFLLQSNLEKLSLIVLMMIPPINGLGGNVGSILGARLTSALHMGTIEPRIRGQRMLRTNVTASWGMSLVTFAFAGVIFFLTAYLIGTSMLGSLRLAAAFFVAGVILTAVIIFTTITAAFISFTRGLDPDNVVIPVVTSIVDVLGVVCLIFAIQILGVS